MNTTWEDVQAKYKRADERRIKSMKKYQEKRRAKISSGLVEVSPGKYTLKKLTKRPAWRKKVNTKNGKTQYWYRCRQRLKKLFMEKGIISCELKLKDCWGNEALSFAHRHKRRWYYAKEELLQSWKQVILACIPCHQVIEKDAKLTEKVFLKLRGNEDNT